VQSGIEEVNNERRLMGCVLDRRVNRGVCLERTIGWRRERIDESERKVSHDPANANRNALDASTNGDRLPAVRERHAEVISPAALNLDDGAKIGAS